MHNQTLGSTIAQLRKQQGLTQMELAARMGVTDRAVSKWERDLSCPDIHAFPRLAEALHVSVEDLLQGQGAAPPAAGKARGPALVKQVCRCVALAMGAAVAALTALNAVDAKSALSLLGIGLAALALSALQDGRETGQ